MKSKIKTIIFILIILVTIVCFIYSTILIIKNKNKREEYSLNNNERYLVSEYLKIVEDMNLFDENLYLIDGYYTMEINSNYITNLDLTFINENNSKYYYLKISDSGNQLFIENRGSELNKVMTIDDYFKICYLGFSKLGEDSCLIEVNKYLGNNIVSSEENYLYANSNLDNVENTIEGTFFEFVFKNQIDKRINVYFKI